jgi:nucleic acid/nucleotide deaminase of polymorphic system toxin
MGRLIGRLVLVALVVFGAYFVITHYNGIANRFGCVAGSATAHADSGDCPANLDAAAGDARWAADRIATIPRTTSATTGLFYDVDGHETRYTSGQEHISTRIDAFLRASRAVRMPPVGQHPAATHVEAKVAMTMREQDVHQSVLVINNPEGPCPGAYSCQQVLDVRAHP